MKTTDTAWLRLVKAARQAGAPGDESAPFGFSTRVSALAMQRPAAKSSALAAVAAFSWRALGLALMLMFLSIVANYSVLASSAEGETEAVLDPVGEILTSS
jgi:hypothetical protein